MLPLLTYSEHRVSFTNLTYNNLYIYGDLVLTPPSATKYLQQGSLPLVPNIYSREHSLCYQISTAGITPSGTKYL